MQAMTPHEKVCREAFDREYPDYADLQKPTADTPADAISAWCVWQAAWKAGPAMRESNNRALLIEALKAAEECLSGGGQEGATLRLIREALAYNDSDCINPAKAAYASLTTLLSDPAMVEEARDQIEAVCGNTPEFNWRTSDLRIVIKAALAAVGRRVGV